MARWQVPWLAVGLWAQAALAGCQPPPPSQFPSAEAALSRMRATYACSHGVSGEAEVDYFGDEGRFRGVTLVYSAVLPDRLRLDLLSSFGVVLSTLTADGEDFSLYDLRGKTFLRGPATSCNVARFTQVPVPPFVLVQLLRGEAPVLVHDPARSTLRWRGRYELALSGKHGATQTIALEPHASDFHLPWQEQRVRVLEVVVSQRGHALYEAHLEGHAGRPLSAPWVDPEGLDPQVPPSGPVCAAQVPGRLRLKVPYSGRDLILKSKEVTQNPPLLEGSFVQAVPSGVSVGRATCAP